jgi:hypothetical protein
MGVVDLLLTGVEEVVLPACRLATRVALWVAEEAWEKVNVVETWRTLKKLGQKYGRRFFVAALALEFVESVVAPSVAAYFKAYWLIPIFIVFHTEPLMYPVFFFAFLTWDRIQGREPWEPERLAQSTYTRAGLQVLSYRVVAFALFYVILSQLGVTPWLLTAYTLGMSFFGFVHDRIWHESNFGIDVPTDTVKPVRVVAKAATYRAASATVMCGMFLALLGHVPAEVWTYQALMFLVHVLIGGWWARSSYGIVPVVKESK